LSREFQSGYAQINGSASEGWTATILLAPEAIQIPRSRAYQQNSAIGRRLRQLLANATAAKGCIFSLRMRNKDAQGATSGPEHGKTTTMR
jgi:hypothetical protein